MDLRERCTVMNLSLGGVKEASLPYPTVEFKVCTGLGFGL